MTREDLKKFELPDSPGIYKFINAGKILYIGKAASLRDRVRSYFAHDLAETRSTAIRGMVEKATSIEWETTESVLEALILEANLIKKHQPKYNVDQKDNKSWNYLVLTKEKFPRVFTIRGRELFGPGLQATGYKLQAVFGPFPHGGALKEAMKLVRKIFPFRDKCVPDSGKPCFNAQIGLCPGVCSGAMSRKEYRETIKNIAELFNGKMGSLRRRLEKEMKEASKSEDFELAGKLRRQVSALTHIRDVSLIKDEYRVSAGGAFRIEAYDVAHTGGSETVGVMTVVIGGEVQKDQYRKFKIRSVTNNDVAALVEVLERRLAHPEWHMPRIIAVDGSTAQIRAAERVLKKAGVSIPVIGVVKDEFHRPVRLSGDEKLVRAYEKEILLANNEAHRYAIGWHRKRSRRSLTS